MDPFTTGLLETIGVDARHGAAITLDDFSESELKDRYEILFDQTGHTIVIIGADFKVTPVANWAEFMTAQERMTCDISSVLGVPTDLFAEVSETLAAAA